MITKPTVLILGAGASKEYGFPLGRDLMDQVCGLRRDTRYFEEMGFEPRLIAEFIAKLAHAGYDSVDLFLEHFKVYREVGKAAIAAVLIPREQSENLFPPHAPHPHWYQLLANRMDIGNVNPSENKLSIITFNYDRSLEHYLFKIIETRCGRGHDDALAQLRQLKIQHVHGVLGHYAPHGEEGRPYSSDANASVVAAAGQGIHIVSDPLEEFVEARKRLEAAERIYFLGFGFHPENVRRLAAFQERGWVRDRDVIVGGTTLGFTREKWIRVETGILNENFTIGYHTQGIHQFLDQAGRLE